MEATTKLFISCDNGQIACDTHRPQYGRIPWSRLLERDQAEMRREVAEIVRPNESLCEICRFEARRTMTGVGR